MDEQAFRRERLLASGLLRGWAERNRAPAAPADDAASAGGHARPELTQPGGPPTATPSEEEADSLA